MNSHPRTRQKSQSFPAVTIAAVVLIGTALGGCGLIGGDSDPVWNTPAASSPATGVSGKPVQESTPVESISLSATGDIIMGDAPDKLPPNDGEGFFDSVTEALQSDFVMGNLEQPLTGDTGTSKCGTPKRPNCFAFRSPPAYADHLREAGFQLLNTANNHSKDYGP